MPRTRADRKTTTAKPTATRPDPEPGTPGADLLKGYDGIGTYSGLGRRMAAHYVSTGKIPVFRLGRRVFARKSDVDQVMRPRRPAE
jgi:hypothetical protein